MGRPSASTWRAVCRRGGGGGGGGGAGAGCGPREYVRSGRPRASPAQRRQRLPPPLDTDSSSEPCGRGSASQIEELYLFLKHPTWHQPCICLVPGTKYDKLYLIRGFISYVLFFILSAKSNGNALS